ncbi:MAG TPA: hypothetical protein VM865_08395, partial [Acidobacteriaceae bacterium]|nr:hypothetical protein [Acidobacteriaceae bacterium]
GAIGLGLTWAVLLRPDQGLLAAAVVPAMVWVGWRLAGSAGWGYRLGPAVVASGIMAGALGLWGVRNWRVFHVVQPLAPHDANDPGEEVAHGFMRWYRTWGVGFPSTVRVYWTYDGSMVWMEDLPARAFDGPWQRAETKTILERYNEEQASTPAVDAAWARLAEERVRAHPVMYYVGLPVARELNMWFRPRVELLKVPLEWWRVRVRPRAAMVAFVFAAVNGVYLLLGLEEWKRWRRRDALVWSMVGFCVLRCALLLTLDNSEPRYTLECFPVVILFAGMAVGGWTRPGWWRSGWWRSGREAGSSLRAE